MTVGEVVKQYRLRKNWTQGQLAAYTGLDQSFVSRLEKGSVKVASPANLQKIADALDAPLKEFLEAAGVTDAPYRPIPEPDPPLIPAGPVYARLRPGSSLPPDLLDLLARVGGRFSPADWARIRGYIERLAEERAPD